MTASETVTASKPVVLFLCTHNAARSQMAEAFLRKLAGDRFEVHSAGLVPTEIHPLTVRVMEEIGISMQGQCAKSLRQFLAKVAAHFAIMVCDPVETDCPTRWPGAKAMLSWPFEDPAAFAGTEEQRLAKFRAIRDQVQARIVAWLKESDATQLPSQE